MINPRLTSVLQRMTKKVAYSDSGALIKNVGTGTFNADNFEITTPVAISFPCSFTNIVTNRRREVWKDFADIQEIDAEVRFEQGNPEKGDTFRLDKRFGVSKFTPLTYEIVAIDDRTGLGWLCALKAVRV